MISISSIYRDLKGIYAPKNIQTRKKLIKTSKRKRRINIHQLTTAGGGGGGSYEKKREGGSYIYSIKHIFLNRTIEMS